MRPPEQAFDVVRAAQTSALRPVCKGRVAFRCEREHDRSADLAAIVRAWPADATVSHDVGIIAWMDYNSNRSSAIGPHPSHPSENRGGSASPVPHHLSESLARS